MTNDIKDNRIDEAENEIQLKADSIIDAEMEWLRLIVQRAIVEWKNLENS